MPRISFNVVGEDQDTIRAIAKRAMAMAKAHRITYPFLDCLMDLQATHANGCPLKLQDLLAADDFNFAHDVFGIRRHINRQTGQLEDCFLPRYAEPSK
jgi:hypothetical protein